jgi:putative Ca2+/H+ antiporter (TMEM165/GDT1 family)
MRTYLAVFASIFLAELGDKTQLATLLFAAHPGVSRTGVFLAAAGALVLSSLLAVLIGGALPEFVAPRRLRILAGIAFVLIGAWMLLTPA